MASLFEFQRGQDRLMHTIMLDFAAILVGYGLSRDQARTIAAKAVQVAKQHVEESPGTLRRIRF